MKLTCELCGVSFEGEGKLCPACAAKQGQHMSLQDSDYEDLWRQAKYAEDNCDSQR